MPIPRALFVALLLAIVGTASPSLAEKPAPKVLILLDDGFNTGEFWQPYYALLGAGYHVDVASPESGVIPAGSKSRDLDTKADLTLDKVDPTDYIGLVIPGGYSPGNLEKYDLALKISKAFMDADKPVAAVCHGPRLLAQAGTLDGRVTTGLYKLKDELPALWRDGRFGTYTDEAVVIDGNLTTSRFPNDVVAFSRNVLLEFEKAGGIDVADKEIGRVIVIDPRAPRQTGWAMGWGGIQAQGIATDVLRTWAIQRFLDAEPDFGGIDAIVVMPGADLEKMGDNAAFKSLVSHASKANRPVWAMGSAAAEAVKKAGGKADTTLSDDVADLPDVLVKVATAVKKSAAQRPVTLIAKIPKPVGAVLAIHTGFDDRVVATMHATLTAAGYDVAVIAPKTGYVKGLAGLPIVATHTYENPPAMNEKTLIVAPGGLWPIDAPAHEPRLKWLLQSYAAGVQMMAFGFDSLWIGKDPQFKGMKFASSDQTVWSFGKKAGRYSNALIEQTSDRLTTAKGAEALPEIIRMLMTTPNLESP